MLLEPPSCFWVIPTYGLCYREPIMDFTKCNIIGFTTGPPTRPAALTVNHSSPLSLLLLWNASYGENITYQLTATQSDDDNVNQKQFIKLWCLHHTDLMESTVRGTYLQWEHLTLQDLATALMQSQPPFLVRCIWLLYVVARCILLCLYFVQALLL